MIPHFDENHELILSEYGQNPLALALPPGYAAKVFIPETLPKTLRQSVKVADITALEAYLRYYVKGNGSTLAVYINSKANTITAVLDHTPSGPKEPVNTNSHVATLVLEYSDEFAPLAGVLGKPQLQAEFLDFIDQHAYLFVEAAALVSVVEAFQQIEVTRFKSVVNQANGTGSLCYETDAAEGSTVVPRSLSIMCPIFQGQPDHRLEITLRTKVTGGKVVFTLLCHALTQIVREAVADVEQRLNDFRVAEEFTEALIVRGDPSLTKPDAPRIIDVETKPLPVGFGTGAPSTVNASASGR
jgi:hypothetical protein